MSANAYIRIREFPNGLGYRELKLYASDKTALIASKRSMAEAGPGESLTLLRAHDGSLVFTISVPIAPLAIESHTNAGDAA